VEDAPATDESRINGAAACLNCGAGLTGRFCSACGQRDVAAYPTIREFVGDTWTELAGWDGRLARTIRLLCWRPGELTRAVLEGQRVQYVSAIRVYLACSLIYFVLVAALQSTVADRPAADAGATVRTDALARAMDSGLQALSPDERAAFDRRLARTPAVLRPIILAAASDYRSFRQHVREAMPRALFALVPMLAVVLAAFYRGHSCLTHLYFAIHFQAFAFVVATLYGFTEWTGSLPLIRAAQAIAAAWIVAYALIALRRVYGGSWWISGAKAVGISVSYGSLWLATAVSVALWVSRNTI
jgi:hypothetical protein